MSHDGKRYAQLNFIVYPVISEFFLKLNMIYNF